MKQKARENLKTLEIYGSQVIDSNNILFDYMGNEKKAEDVYSDKDLSKDAFNIKNNNAIIIIDKTPIYLNGITKKIFLDTHCIWNLPQNQNLLVPCGIR